MNGENEYCSDGINVSYAFPMKSDTIFVRTFERGVDFTNACGTAMAASALVAKMNHLVEGETVTVFNPGGFVKCKVFVNNTDHLTLIGNATILSVYRIEIVENQYKFLSREDTVEQLQYEDCIKIVRNETACFISY